jgi:hypothetical protein
MGQLSAYTNTFAAGTKAKATEVNTNFTEIKTVHNATDAELPTYTNGSRVIVSNSGKTAMVEATATTTEVNYLAGVTSAVQTQFDAISSSTNIILGDGTVKPTAILEYASDLSGDMTSGSNEIPSIKWIEDNIILPPKYIYGLSPSNGTDSNNDIDISLGECKDDTGVSSITLSSAITKRLDATFSEGTGQGGLNTGSKATSTWYDLYAISKDNGTADVMFSTYADRETLPNGFTYKRFLGMAVLTDSSGNIRLFKAYRTNDGTLNYKWYYSSDTQGETELDVAVDVTKTNLTIKVPTGRIYEPMLTVDINNSNANTFLRLYDLNTNSYFETNSSPQGSDIISNIYSDTSSRVAYLVSASYGWGAGSGARIRNLGYKLIIE